MKAINRYNRSERGAVSLFVVIFTALLITTITISFVQLMVRDQRQAMYSDLSESAYDSAVAGVEDAKRALLMQQDCLGDSSPQCLDLRAAIDSGECTTLATIFNGGLDETPIIQTEGDKRLEQAYTCVKIKQDTDDFIGTIDQNRGAILVPLRGIGSFNKIVVSWALNRDGSDVTFPAVGARTLPKEGANWPETHPALLRAQLINGQDAFNLADLNSGGYSNTLFLYPSSPLDTGLKTASFRDDARREAADGKPQPIKCENPNSGAYACSVTIDIGDTIPARSQTAFLNLMAFYNATDFRIELRRDETRVPFNGVQPEVDSTGRANDLFRRVISRVELNNTFNYPTAALETRYDICKDFSVTTEERGYKSSTECHPEAP